jgi:hypothetical protein
MAILTITVVIGDNSAGCDDDYRWGDDGNDDKREVTVGMYQYGCGRIKP